MRRTLPLLTSLVLLAGCGWSSVQAAAPPSSPAVAPASAVGAADGQVRLWQDAAIFAPVRRLLDGAGAGQPVWVEMYEFGRADLAAALQRARQRGADVRLIVDRTVPASARMADRLAGAGLAVRAYPVDDSRNQIDHVKLLLTAGAALVGGMNWGVNSARNHDYAFETETPSLLQRLSDIFVQDWSISGGRPAPLRPAVGPIAQTTPAEEVRDRLNGALAGARRSVAAEVFVLTDPDVIAALAAARRRGARVRVLLDPGQDVNRPSLDLLRAAGVEARWYPVPPGAKLHAKAGLFDGRELLLGSANWSRSGLSVNHELDLLSDDTQAAATFASRFERDWSTSG
ncbi:MAG TPA: phosphatidylserine/phosphatidylglycerophosphate/cardiolipin synthase family protein [Candidatus Dormibacteraeota bacterium]|nr:phosphatidylserine/phosphatidylglycerophosphate/cardiolipin synthase family protein [Candidatus Dormibacteraeota bacterium]